MPENETKLHEQARDGEAARFALEQLGPIIAKIKAEYIDFWEKTPARDTDARERLWQAVQIAGKVETHLKLAITHGEQAVRDINDIARFGKKRAWFGVA